MHDWIHLPTVEKFALRHFGGDDDFPDSMLVNGHGPYQVILINTKIKIIKINIFINV